MLGVEASDEALFANLDWIKENEAQVQIFVNALLGVRQEMNEDPTIVSRETDPDWPIGQSPKEILDSLPVHHAEHPLGVRRAARHRLRPIRSGTGKWNS